MRNPVFKCRECISLPPTVRWTRRGRKEDFTVSHFFVVSSKRIWMTNHNIECQRPSNCFELAAMVSKERENWCACCVFRFFCGGRPTYNLTRFERSDHGKGSQRLPPTLGITTNLAVASRTTRSANMSPTITYFTGTLLNFDSLWGVHPQRSTKSVQDRKQKRYSVQGQGSKLWTDYCITKSVVQHLSTNANNICTRQAQLETTQARQRTTIETVSTQNVSSQNAEPQKVKTRQ